MLFFAIHRYYIRHGYMSSPAAVAGAAGLRVWAATRVVLRYGSNHNRQRLIVRRVETHTSITR